MEIELADRRRIDEILNLIAIDDKLCERFAHYLGEDLDEFRDWLDNVKVVE